MLTLRKLINKPKLTDSHPLAVFYYCDEAVNHQMQELNHLMKTTPDNLDRRATLIRQLKEAQHNLMNVIFAITRDAVPEHNTCRDFRAKYPDDVLVDQINGPLWFGAECIAAGSHILNHELESEQLRPFAIQLSKTISRVRVALKEQCLTNRHLYSQRLKDMLKEFDVMWADFEFRYVGLMCSVKSERQYYHQQDVIVLFCESTLRALKREYIDHDMIEMMDPSIMFAIPRLAIVCGLVVCPDGPINPSRPAKELPPFFRGYQTLLARIKELLGYLTEEQLVTLEKALCTSEGLGSLNLTTPPPPPPHPSQQTTPPTESSTPPRPLSGPTSLSPPPSQSNPATPSPPRRDVTPLSRRPSLLSHQRSHSLDLATQALETTPSRRDHRERAGLDLPLSHSLLTTPGATTGRAGEDATATGGAAEASTQQEVSGAETAARTCNTDPDDSTTREMELFPRFEPDQPVVNNLPMATPFISSPLPTARNDNKHAPTSPSSSPSSPSSSPSTKSRQGRRSGSKRRSKGPAGFASADDLMHRLFVAISGVADQLQTNHARDLRVILKHVFAVCQSEPEEEEEKTTVVAGREKMEAQEEGGSSRGFIVQPNSTLLSNADGLVFGGSDGGSETGGPNWVPDSDCLSCMACHEAFSWRRRRHHCRSCGQVICARCSPHSLPLPVSARGGGVVGETKQVRVCNSCYLRQLGVAARISVTTHTPATPRAMEVV